MVDVQGRDGWGAAVSARRKPSPASDDLRTLGTSESVLLQGEPGDGRVVAQFSCGAASAVATKLALEQYGDRVHVINAFVADEEEDNRRFLADVERWLGVKIVVLRDEKYGARTAQVWTKKRFLVHKNGAPCSKALKRDVLNAYDEPGDIVVLGYTADPRDAGRLNKWIDANPGRHVIAPLIDAGLTKADCFEIIRKAGIELPSMYRLGYHNANCPGCPKGGMGYWNLVRITHPDRFEQVARIQDLLGPGSYFFRVRTGPEKGKRISLRMLDPEAGRHEPLEDFECGAACEMPEQLDMFHDDEEAA